jgi:hypothetical protein
VRNKRYITWADVLWRRLLTNGAICLVLQVLQTELVDLIISNRSPEQERR